MGEPSAGSREQRRRHRVQRNSIIFAVGVSGMVVETIAAVGFNEGPHAILVGAFLACMFAPAGLSWGDKRLDALRFLDQTGGEDAKRP